MPRPNTFASQPRVLKSFRVRSKCRRPLSHDTYVGVMDHPKRISAISCLVQGVKSLRSSLLVSLIFTLVLSALGQFPTLIARLKGLHFYTATASLWGFMTSILFWLTQTLIL